MTAEPIDFAAVKAAHAGSMEDDERYCDECCAHFSDGCEPYRLAEALADARAEVVRLAGKVARVVEAASDWRTSADQDEKWLNGPRVSVSEAHELPGMIQQARNHAQDVDDALADQPEQVQP